MTFYQYDSGMQRTHLTLTTLLVFLAVNISSECQAQSPSGTRYNFRPWQSPNQARAMIGLGNFDQTRHWAATPSWSHPQMGHDSEQSDIDLFQTPHPLPVDGSGQDPLLTADWSEPLLRPVRNLMQLLYEDDIRVSISDALVYQNVSRTFDGAAPNSLYNRFDVMASIRTWSLQGQGDGIFTALIRANNNLLDTPTPGEASGSFSPLDDIASNTGFLINRFEFQQEFLDKRVSLTIGKANPNDIIAANLFAWDEDRQFMSVTFDGGNYPAGYGGYFPMVGLQIIPVDGIYVSGLINTGVGDPRKLFPGVDDGLYFAAAETGVVLQIGEEKRQGRYSISLMNSNVGPETTGRDDRTSGNAIALVAQQEIAKDMAIWSQYLLSSENIGPASQEFTLGFSIENCFSRTNDGFGAAIGWSQPSERYYVGWRQNLQFETYYRLQLTHSIQISPDFQIVRPSDPAAESGAVFAFGLRILTSF